MSLITKAEFSNIANAKAGYKTLSTIVNESRTFSKTSAKTSIFLSHSHNDKDVVQQAVTFFRTLGIAIYVDWMDETMPENTSGVTATNIKSKIISNDKFILLATNSAVASKWCNWEVGVGDTFKYSTNKLAILPLADNNSTWTGNEYLQIYPRIEKKYSFINDDFELIFPNGTRMELKTWLNS